MVPIERDDLFSTVNVHSRFHLRLSQEFLYRSEWKPDTARSAVSGMTRTHNLRGCFDLKLFIHGFETDRFLIQKAICKAT